MPPILLAGNEREQLLHLWQKLLMGFKYLSGRREAHFGPKQQPVGFHDCIDLKLREAAPPQGNKVCTARSSRHALGEHERRHVLQHPADARHKRPPTDPNEMMHSHCPRERRVRVHSHMPTEERAIGNRDVILHLTVMGDMAGRHQKVVATEDGSPFFFLTPAVDRDTLPNHIPVTDHHLGGSSAIADVLRLTTDHTPGVEDVVSADAHTPKQRHTVSQDRSGADLRFC